MKRILNDTVISSESINYLDNNAIVALIVPENEKPRSGVRIYTLQSVEKEKWVFVNILRMQISLTEEVYSTPKSAVDDAIISGYCPIYFSDISEYFDWIGRQSAQYAPF